MPHAHSQPREDPFSMHFVVNSMCGYGIAEDMALYLCFQLAYICYDVSFFPFFFSLLLALELCKFAVILGHTNINVYGIGTTCTCSIPTVPDIIRMYIWKNSTPKRTAL